MLKSILYYVIALTTGLRLVDMVYLLVKGDANLPMSVMIIAGAMIIYGLVLVVKKYLGNVTMRQLLFFFGVQSVMIITNLIIVAIHVPMRITIAETFIVGSFLDIIVAVCALYAGFKHLLNTYQPFVRVVSKEQA